MGISERLPFVFSGVKYNVETVSFFSKVMDYLEMEERMCMFRYTRPEMGYNLQFRELNNRTVTITLSIVLHFAFKHFV